MSARARSKAYVPVLVQVCRYTASEKGIIVMPLAEAIGTLHLPFKGRTVLLQHVDSAGLFADPYDPADLLQLIGDADSKVDAKAAQRADLCMRPCVIAWVQKWLIMAKADEGLVVPEMTPPTPVKAKS